MDNELGRAKELYERAIFNGEYDVLPQADRELDAVEAALLIGRGRVMHGHYLETQVEIPEELPAFERAADLYRALGDEGGEAEAQFWIGCFHQVVRDDNASAVPYLTAASELARKTGDQLILSYALRHLGVAAHMAGDLDDARALLEESTALRRTLGFTAGVAANLVGLIYVVAAQGRPDDAQALADEATELAASSGAVMISTQIEAARSRI